MKRMLISQYKNGNELQIEQIFIKYSSYVCKIIKNMSHNLTNEDVEEIVLDVFLIIWNNKEKLKSDFPIEPYMASITRNIVKNRYRQLPINDNIDDYESAIEDLTDIQLLVEQKEKNKLIEETLNTMKQQDKDIFILFYYQSMSINEIASKLNMSKTNIKTKLHRIRKKIRESLIKGGYYYGK